MLTVSVRDIYSIPCLQAAPCIAAWCSQWRGITAARLKRKKNVSSHKLIKHLSVATLGSDYSYALTCQHLQSIALGEIWAESGFLQVIQMFYFQGNKLPNFRQYSLHGEVCLPLATLSSVRDLRSSRNSCMYSPLSQHHQENCGK